MNWIQWYDTLAKPAWTPGPPVISLIWKLLYPIIVVSFGYVFVQTFQRRIPGWVCVPFAINLAANLLFMPIFSGLRNVPLAAADILVVWTTIVWCMIAIWPFRKWVMAAQVPYFIWVSIATVLQLSITAMNWGRA